MKVDCGQLFPPKRSSAREEDAAWYFSLNNESYIFGRIKVKGELWAAVDPLDFSFASFTNLSKYSTFPNTARRRLDIDACSIFVPAIEHQT